MPRQNRVLSFMSEWGGNNPNRKNTSSNSPSASNGASPAPPSPSAKQPTAAVTTPTASTTNLDSNGAGHELPQSPSSQVRSDSKPSSRPMSMIQTYQPPVMEVSQDTLPELQRIFTFLNSHSNKLYQEGYFLKFHDTDSRGRPAQDRVWQECFAQLVGTILSLWDASELDTVGGDAEVLPTFINLTDAAIHMMPSMVLNDGKKLDNVLSVSTAASNKYLFHFNSFNSLTQWTAGIRLAMYEHTTLQEAYTGALIAGKGRTLNNIRIILDRQRAKHEDWARVRFGAGTPWRRCWCVVEPPDEKEYAKLQKQAKKNVYNKSPVILKGSMKFYDTNKVKKKTRPIATVTDAFSCYAIYPQSKPLIDQSTLVKVEGKITIHAKPDTVTEGFVFVMPETHPAVSGFEIMLRFLFPVFDTFALYGRPNKLIADVLDTRGLMFAMPPDRRYGYLEMWDVVSLIHSEGSASWSERQWRKQLKELTSKRMLSAPSRTSSRASRANRVSLPPSRTRSLRFDGSVQSQPTTRQSSPSRADDLVVGKTRRVDSAPPSAGAFAPPRHQRSVSEAHGYKKYQSETPSRLNQMTGPGEYDTPPAPPLHRELNGATVNQDYDTSDGEPSPDARDVPELQIDPTEPPKGPVASPPSFNHAPSQRPPVQPYHPPSTQMPNAHMDSATLDQLADATHQPIPAGIAAAGAAAAWRSSESLHSRRSGDYDRDGQGRLNPNSRGLSADSYSNSRSGLSGNRLPTIPASPYIEQPDSFDSPTHSQFQPTAPPVPEHAELPQSSNTDLPLRAHPGSGEAQIHRKPVPGRSSTSSSRGDFDNRSTTSSSLGSLRNKVIDPDALDSLNNSSLMRSTSKSSSRYDDDAFSTSTPDYASTISEEVQPRKPGRYEDRPRSGMLKSIGNPNVNAGVGPDNNHDTLPGEMADIPKIDFGPTYSLTPGANGTKRPGTSGTMTQALHDTEPSKSKENLAHSPGEQKHPAWLSGRTTPIAAMHMRSSSASPNFAPDTRTIPWSPGMTSQQPSSDKQKLGAEEWVNQRASAAYYPPHASPVFAHGRSKSHTPPPMIRAHSGDWAHLQRTPDASASAAMPARPPSRPLSRPVSRGATHLLDQRPTSLSAREQEQVARMTGTPLLDLNHGVNKKPQESSEGLAAYIGHREKEKAKAKANRGSSAALQAEVDRRLMQAQQRQMKELQGMQQRSMTPNGFSMPGVSPGAMYQQPGFAYSSPDQLNMFQPQQQGYYQQQQTPMGMPGAWTQTPTPGAQPMNQSGYFMGAGQPMQQQQMNPGYAASVYSMAPTLQQPMQQPIQQQQQQQRPYTQPYGASFDQAQAAARFAHQQQYRRQ